MLWPSLWTLKADSVTIAESINSRLTSTADNNESETTQRASIRSTYCYRQCYAFQVGSVALPSGALFTFTHTLEYRKYIMCLIILYTAHSVPVMLPVVRGCVATE
jgi:hypothetical protein